MTLLTKTRVSDDMQNRTPVARKSVRTWSSLLIVTCLSLIYQVKIKKCYKNSRKV